MFAFKAMAGEKSEYSWLKMEDIPKIVKNSKERSKKRRIANLDSCEGKSEKLKQYTDRMINVKMPSEVANLLNEFTDPTLFKSKAAEQDLLYYAAVLGPIKSMRGIVYRLSDLAKKQKITHSSLITLIMNFANSIRIYAPYRNVDAFMKYLVQPYYVEKKNVVSKFKTFSEFQDYLNTTVYKALKFSVIMLDDNHLGQIKSKIIWDNKIIHGPDSFKSGINRCRYIYEVDRQVTLASMHASMASVKMMTSYDMNNILRMVKDQGKNFGIDGFWTREAEGVTAYDKTKVYYRSYLKGGWKNCRENNKFDNDYVNLYVRRNSGKDSMLLAYKHLTEAYLRTVDVWNDLKGRGEEERAIINPAKVTPWNKNIDENMALFQQALKGQVKAYNFKTGEHADINLYTFFHNPPRDLKNFLPYCFELDNKKSKTEEGLSYRNYRYGQAMKWKFKEFVPYLPGVKSKEDLFRSARVFNQIGGQWIGLKMPTE